MCVMWEDLKGIHHYRHAVCRNRGSWRKEMLQCCTRSTAATDTRLKHCAAARLLHTLMLLPMMMVEWHGDYRVWWHFSTHLQMAAAVGSACFGEVADVLSQPTAIS